MEESTKPEAEAARFRQDIRSLLRTRVREAIEITLEEELAAVLGCGRYERSGERLGYRNGTQRPELMPELMHYPNTERSPARFPSPRVRDTRSATCSSPTAS